MSCSLFMALLGVVAGQASGEVTSVVRCGEATVGQITLPLPEAWRKPVSIPQLPPCDHADTDSWVRDLRDRVLSYNRFALYAIEAYGDPVRCEGGVTDQFDGMKFGAVLLGFADGVTLEVVTMPPEIGISTLRVPSGFDDAAGARALLHAYADDVGLSIDWSAEEEAVSGGERIVSYRDPEPGMNASAATIFDGDRVVGLRVTLAP